MKTRLLRSNIILVTLAALALCLVIDETDATAQQSTCGPTDSRGSVTDCGTFVDPSTGNNFTCSCTNNEVCVGLPNVRFSGPPATGGECSEPNGTACSATLQCDGFAECLGGACCTRINIGTACQSCTGSGCVGLCGAQPDGCGTYWDCGACANAAPVPAVPAGPLGSLGAVLGLLGVFVGRRRLS